MKKLLSLLLMSLILLTTNPVPVKADGPPIGDEPTRVVLMPTYQYVSK